MTRKMTLPLWGVLILTAMLFGSSFLFIKMSVAGIPPFTLAAGRAALAAAAVLLFMRLAGQHLPAPGRAWIPMILLGLLTAAIPYAAIAWGQLHIDSSLGGILFAAIPVFSMLIAPLFLGEEKFSLNRVLGVALGFGGVVLAIGPEASSGLDTQVLGAAVTLLAALSYACGNIFARTRSGTHPIVLATGQLVVATLVLVPVSLWIDAPWALSPSTAQLASLTIVAVFNTALPVLMMFWLIRAAGASNASLLAFFMPVVSVVLGVAVLGERLGWYSFLGFGLIILGAGLVTGNVRPRRQSASRHV